MDHRLFNPLHKVDVILFIMAQWPFTLLLRRHAVVYTSLSARHRQDRIIILRNVCPCCYVSIFISPSHGWCTGNTDMTG